MDIEKEQNIINNLQEEFTQNLKLINTIIIEIKNNEKASLELMAFMNKEVDELTSNKVDLFIGL